MHFQTFPYFITNLVFKKSKPHIIDNELFEVSRTGCVFRRYWQQSLTINTVNCEIIVENQHAYTYFCLMMNQQSRRLWRLYITLDSALSIFHVAIIYFLLIHQKSIEQTCYKSWQCYTFCVFQQELKLLQNQRTDSRNTACALY